MARLLFAALGFTVCLLRSPTVHCSVCAPLEFKIDTLRSANLWWFETESRYCYQIPSALRNSTKCIFLFAVCKPVAQACPEKSGVCQAAETKVHSYKFYSFPIDQGGYGSEPNFKTGRNDFSVVYSPVKLYDSGIEYIKTTITFKCNPGSKWNTNQSHEAFKNPPGPEAPAPVEIVMVTHNTSNTLEYTFVFNSSEGCRIGGPSPGPGGDSTFTPSSLSVGSILLILFFPAVFLYCFIGVLINCGSGKTGREVIPNSKFWCNLPGLIMDGFGFCIAKLTCQEMTSTTESYNRM